ncbi:hypothetical protein ONS95_005812 [Cadophora gregata]|uniref:uncharacterized protein n=1 Tax=Cadophora gregata TaxID=51156 RepID=UPI0026DC8D5B|nr:uncharacterized protein ONS95_005812 [Cadophora gregata]KAK0103813.1 hypothetical protein ONS95_005812 [Cadophora gregata]
MVSCLILGIKVANIFGALIDAVADVVNRICFGSNADDSTCKCGDSTNRSFDPNRPLGPVRLNSTSPVNYRDDGRGLKGRFGYLGFGPEVENLELWVGLILASVAQW